MSPSCMSEEREVVEQLRWLDASKQHASGVIWEHVPTLEVGALVWHRGVCLRVKKLLSPARRGCGCMVLLTPSAA